ncbi:TonB family protein [Phenylobacterium sp.]|uniref:TonB family protein n=1 Tax=Phenylobacterium sp. TaxID=1871053 RepID=UPI002B91BB71|nr:TonB family protein [Phenylobacterium sp.]HLZ77673.1 TonB family protein [Phenylobacterium sp.]
MLAELLALFAAAAPESAAPTRTVSPVTVTATPSTEIAGHPDATVNSAGSSDDALGDALAIWPRRAYHSGASGRVTLSCRVDAHGLAEWCRVIGESPAGQGFGRAALEMRPSFKLTPVQGPDGPITAMMTVNVGFKAPATELDSDGTGAATAANTMGAAPVVSGPIHGNRLEMHAVVMVDNPVWTSAANFDDLARAYPAKGGGAEGYAAAHCQVQRSGRDAGALSRCQIIKESPKGQGFGQAAISLMPKFRVMPAVLARAPGDAPLWVDVPVRLSPPDKAAERTVKAPIWLLNVDPESVPKVFPPEAAAKGLTSGRGVVRCTVADDGTVGSCVPEPGDPDGLGFSEAAVKLATAMRMNLWSADGAPVEGGVVHIPIRINLRTRTQ